MRTAVQSPRVLIIENNFLIAEMVNDMVRDLGYGVTKIVYRLPSALKEIDKDNFDCALVNVGIDAEKHGIEYHNATRTLTNTPAPAPDMTSQAVLAQPKTEPKYQATISAEARAARAEAPPKEARVEVSAKTARAEAPPPNNPDTRPTTYHQTPFFDRFSIKGY